MRIQHNIMAMSAYRNYTNNVSAMKKNLEKLSSGYKINRAGDDAAGLAISEKMRAQITGLETAQKNAKDGISLVQTAEGALTEVHDMLNRMVELASMSANGTYDNTTDRAQLQKEVDQLVDEINRIADSSNFNGIKLLDGSMSTDAAKITGDARIISDVYTSGNAAALSGTKTFLDGEVGTERTPTVFDVDFTGLTAKLGGEGAVHPEYTPDDTGVDGVTATVDAEKAGDGDVKIQVDKATADKKAEVTVGDFTITGGAEDTSENGITFKLVASGEEKADQATTAAWDAATGTVTITAAKDATAADIQGAIQALGDKSADGGGKFGAFTVAGTLTTGALDDAGDIDDGVTSGGAATGDFTVTLTSGTGDTYTETIAAADWKDNVTVANTEKGVSVTIDTAKVNDDLAEDTLGSVATPAAPAGADTNVDFTFTIAGKEFTVDAAAGAALSDGDDATAIATAVFNAIGANVEINGTNYTVADNGNGKLTFTLKDEPTDDNIAANFDWDVKGLGDDSFEGNHTAGVVVTTPGSVKKDAPVANTVFKLEANDIKDGTKITIDGTSVVLAVGKNSAYKSNLAAANKGTVPAQGSTTGYIDLTWMEENDVDLNKAISAISEGFAGAAGDDGAGGSNWIVGVNDTSNKDTHPGLTIHKTTTNPNTYDTKAKLAAVFEIEKEAGKGLTLQIGDTADTYNQLNVSIKDMHAASLGISGIDISTQDGAADAITKIKDAINSVSDVRGTLGATQNRLDHTINNLSVMTENIQDAESTIRDVDVAEEMMAYTKNNILIQSAQAMLAQANQVPQGVLQLLQ